MFKSDGPGRLEVANPVGGSVDNHHRDTIPHAKAVGGETGAGNYGRLIYEIHEHVEKTKMELTRSQLHVRFYETVVTFEHTEKFLCYPEAFVVSTIPKYRIRNIVVSKAQIPKWMFYAGVGGFILGIVLFIVGGQEKQKNSSSDSGSGSSGSGGGSGGGGDNSSLYNAGGAILLIGGIALLALPFFLNKFFVTLTLAVPKHNPSIYNWLFPVTEETVTFRVTERPNDAILMDYAYGSLKMGMEDMHALVSPVLSCPFQPMHASSHVYVHMFPLDVVSFSHSFSASSPYVILQTHLINDNVTTSLHPVGWKDTRV